MLKLICRIRKWQIMNPLLPSILILDDDSMIAATLKATLVREKYDVILCCDPQEALALVVERNFAVVISDNNMPQMTGLDFLRECRRLCPQSSRILLTGDLDLSAVDKAVECREIGRFITKPWLREDLIAAVRDASQSHDFIVGNPATGTSPASTPGQSIERGEKLNQNRTPNIECVPVRVTTAPGNGPANAS
jgi:DNA-binding NtrC family response regulator